MAYFEIYGDATVGCGRGNVFFLLYVVISNISCVIIADLKADA